jgi:hypothetical protein
METDKNIFINRIGMNNTFHNILLWQELVLLRRDDSKYYLLNLSKSAAIFLLFTRSLLMEFQVQRKQLHAEPVEE